MHFVPSRWCAAGAGDKMRAPAHPPSRPNALEGPRMFSTPLRRVFAASALLLCLGFVFFAGEGRDAPFLLPHGVCYTWNPALLWTHVVSDTLIGLAYISIPATLLHLVRRRTDMPFDWLIVLFALFIVSCGATHWVEVWTVWHP